MEAEEFQAPAVLLSCFTPVTVTVHVTEFSDVQVSNRMFSKFSTSWQLKLEQQLGCNV